MVDTTCTVPWSLLFPSDHQKPAGPRHTAQGREEVLVDRRRNRGEVADLGLTVKLLSSV